MRPANSDFLERVGWTTRSYRSDVVIVSAPRKPVHTIGSFSID